MDDVVVLVSTEEDVKAFMEGPVYRDYQTMLKDWEQGLIDEYRNSKPPLSGDDLFRNQGNQQAVSLFEGIFVTLFNDLVTNKELEDDEDDS